MNKESLNKQIEEIRREIDSASLFTGYNVELQFETDHLPLQKYEASIVGETKLDTWSINLLLGIFLKNLEKKLGYRVYIQDIKVSDL